MSLASQFAQVSTRARVYKLEDDGASELARRKRTIKNRRRHAREVLAALAERQEGRSRFPPLDDERAAVLRQRWEAVIEEVPETVDGGSLIAPVRRRVAREDRRRRRREK